MNIFRDNKIKVGDYIRTNINGGSSQICEITGVISHIDYECDNFYILNNTHQGSDYEGWEADAQRYNMLYCWKLCFECDDDCYIEFIHKTNPYTFLCRKRLPI